MTFPAAVDPDEVGRYSGKVHSGGGYVWDEVLEYRVWCYPRLGAEDFGNGDYYYAFATHEEAAAASAELTGVGARLTLVLQREYIAEPPGRRVHPCPHEASDRVASGVPVPSHRDERTIPVFRSSDEPEHRLAILHGEQPLPNG